MWCIGIASSQQSFLTNALTPQTYKPKLRAFTVSSAKTISCSYPQDDQQQSPRCCVLSKNEIKVGKLAIVALAAGMLTLGSVHDASAAKTGGRVGGQVFRSSAPRSAPRINNNSRTIYVPPVAPLLVGGYGCGIGMPFCGGWGWSPFSLFAPGPSVAVGIEGGLETIVLFIFLGAAAAVVRKYFWSRDENDY